jgi:hypothetical protein
MRLYVSMVALAAFALAGCYKSNQDLIGSHATHIVQANTLLNFDGTAYFYQSPNAICIAEMSPSGTLACGSLSPLTIERTPLGNYIVQVGRGTPRQYYYFLWFRDNDPLKNDCMVTLGKDVAGIGSNSIVAGAVVGGGQRISTGVLPRGLESELLSRFPNAIISNRRSLLEIAALYETSFLTLRTCGEFGAARLNYQRAGLVIDGDRRHLPDYDSDPN